MEATDSCRCCLRYPADKDLTALYIYLGKTEIYADMLKHCFGINLELVDGASRGICWACVGRLRDATDFKLQVLYSQEELQAQLGNDEAPVEELGTVRDIKIERMSDDDPLLMTETEDGDCNSLEAETLEQPSTSPMKLELLQNDNASTHTGEKTYTCDLCKKCFTKKSVLRKHIHSHLSQLNEIPRTNPTFPLLANNYMDKNINNHSKNTFNALGVDKSQNTHRATHTGVKLFKCNQCEYRTKVKPNLRVHERTHTGEKPYSCNYCSYRSSHKTYLNKHFKIHTGEKPYQCEHCDFKCVRKYTLVVHLRVHTGDKPYQCDVCNRKFRLKYQLGYHQIVHTGETRYSCKECDFKCRFLVQLRRHLKRHTGEKPYRCKSCEFICTLQSELELHQLSQCTKVHRCRRCDFTCGRNNDLRIHRKVHNADRRYKCNYCSYDSSHSSNFHRHVRTQHPDEEE